MSVTWFAWAGPANTATMPSPIAGAARTTIARRTRPRDIVLPRRSLLWANTNNAEDQVLAWASAVGASHNADRRRGTTMTTEELQDVKLEVADHVATITFFRPERLNAFRAATMREFLGVLDRTDAEDDVR